MPFDYGPPPKVQTQKFVVKRHDLNFYIFFHPTSLHIEIHVFHFTSHMLTFFTKKGFKTDFHGHLFDVNRE